jgi:DNA recombination-dependent growth factor C
MPAAKGTITYATWYVTEEPGEDFRDQLMDAIKKHAFIEVDVDAGKDRSIGWTVMGEPFNVSMTWDKVFVDPYVCISLREDTIKVPKTAFQAYYDKREVEYMKESGKDMLKKSERATLKEDVLLNLRKRALPDIKTFDVVWNTLEGSLRLWTHSKKINESFEEIVRETWGVRIVPQAPYTVMMARQDDPEMANVLLDLSPADLVREIEEPVPAEPAPEGEE